MPMNKKTDYGSEQPLKETTYLMETEDGMMVRVPESKLESWQKAQSGSKTSPELTKAEQRLRDRIMQDIFGSKR